jgi:hypothetical protein
MKYLPGKILLTLPILVLKTTVKEYASTPDATRVPPSEFVETRLPRTRRKHVQDEILQPSGWTIQTMAA